MLKKCKEKDEFILTSIDEDGNIEILDEAGDDSFILDTITADGEVKTSDMLEED